MREVDPRVELASGEFDRRKASVQQPGIDAVARLFGVSRRKLVNYRANYISRLQRRGARGSMRR